MMVASHHGILSSGVLLPDNTIIGSATNKKSNPESAVVIDRISPCGAVGSAPVTVYDPARRLGRERGSLNRGMTTLEQGPPLYDRIS